MLCRMTNRLTFTGLFPDILSRSGVGGVKESSRLAPEDQASGGGQNTREHWIFGAKLPPRLPSRSIKSLQVSVGLAWPESFGSRITPQNGNPLLKYACPSRTLAQFSTTGT